MRRWLGWAVMVAAVVGCKQERPAPSAPGAPAALEEQDALWQLAPPGAKVGAVLSARGVAMVEHGALAIRALIDQAPDLAQIKQALDASVREELGTATPLLADYGLSHDKGLASFLAEDKGDVLVLPVVDRAKFVAKLHGTTTGDTDQIRGYACKQLGAHYVCVEKPETFAQLGKSGLDAARKAITTRGDFELAVTGLGSAAGGGSIQMSPGAFIVRGVVTGLPAKITDQLGAPIDLHADTGAAGFGAFNIAPYLAMVNGDAPIGNGVTLSSLTRSLAGTVLLTAPAGTNHIELHVPLRDAGPAKALIEHCTQLAPLVAIGATQRGAACQVPVPKAGITVDAAVADHEIRLDLRGFGGEGTLAHLPPTAIGELIASSPWTMASDARGTLFDATFPEAARAQLPTAELAKVIRALSTINELGAALRVDGANISFVLGVRTIWANPDDVVAKVLAITPDQVLAGAARATARQLADAAPATPFAADYRAGLGGTMVFAFPVGVTATVAVPAFMDYMARAKRSEAVQRP